MELGKDKSGFENVKTNEPITALATATGVADDLARLLVSSTPTSTSTSAIPSTDK